MKIDNFQLNADFYNVKHLYSVVLLSRKIKGTFLQMTAYNEIPQREKCAERKNGIVRRLRKIKDKFIKGGKHK